MCVKCGKKVSVCDGRHPRWVWLECHQQHSPYNTGKCSPVQFHLSWCYFCTAQSICAILASFWACHQRAWGLGIGCGKLLLHLHLLFILPLAVAHLPLLCRLRPCCHHLKFSVLLSEQRVKQEWFCELYFVSSSLHLLLYLAAAVVVMFILLWGYSRYTLCCCG